ncbi:MAG: SpoIIIAC/SpoIIIAD family protein, partial [Gemmiger sp.]
MLIFQLAALTFTAAVLCLTLKKDQPAFAFLVSVCAAAGVLAAVLHQAQPVLDWLDT